MSDQVLINRGKDKQIRLWDAIGGMCVQTLADCLGEITSVEFDREGKYLLAGCKDNSNRLFDLRMVSSLPFLIIFYTASLILDIASLLWPSLLEKVKTDSSNATYTDTLDIKILPRT